MSVGSERGGDRRYVSTIDHGLALRLLSWTGLAPLGAFLVLHAMVDARALGGPRAFSAAVDGLAALPMSGWLFGVFVIAPLAVHTGLGVWATLSGQGLPIAPDATRVRGVMRATGVIALGYLVLHVPELMVIAPGRRLDGDMLGSFESARLSATVRGIPLLALGHITGAVAVVTHFMTGAWCAWARGSGRAASPAARRAAGWVLGVLGVGLSSLYVDAIVLRATGVAFGVRSLGDDAPLGPCPPPAP